MNTAWNSSPLACTVISCNASLPRQCLMFAGFQRGMAEKAGQAAVVGFGQIVDRGIGQLVEVLQPFFAILFVSW